MPTLDHFKKEAVGIGSAWDLGFDYSLTNSVHNKYNKDKWMGLDLGLVDGSQCTIIQVNLQSDQDTNKLSNLKIGMSYDIPFSVGFPGSNENKVKWRLRLFPTGITRFCKDYMSLFLCLDSTVENQNVHVNFSFTGSQDDNYEQVFSAGDMWGLKQWRKKNDLDKRAYYDCINGCHNRFNKCKGCNSKTITRLNEREYKCSSCGAERRCPADSIFTVYEILHLITFYLKLTPLSEKSDPSQVSSENSNANLDYCQQLFAKPDIILNCQDSIYYFYKEILTKESEVFKAMFNHDTVEKQTSTIDINVDIDPFNLKFILSFLLYDDKASYRQDKLNWSSILNFANYYNLKKLKKLAGDNLLASITVSNAVDTLLMADNNDVEGLRSYCLNYIANNLAEVKSSESWKNFKHAPLVLFELFDISFSQSIITMD